MKIQCSTCGYRSNRDDYITHDCYWVFRARHEAAEADKVCGVEGLPPEADRLLACELPKGHIGYHKAGSSSWLGYYP